MTEKTDREKQAHFAFLDDLRDSGDTNMWGASTYLQQEFSDLTHKEAIQILVTWMKSK